MFLLLILLRVALRALHLCVETDIKNEETLAENAENAEGRSVFFLLVIICLALRTRHLCVERDFKVAVLRRQTGAADLF